MSWVWKRCKHAYVTEVQKVQGYRSYRLPDWPKRSILTLEKGIQIDSGEVIGNALITYCSQCRKIKDWCIPLI